MIKSSSSFYLNNYDLGWKDIGLCLITGLTGAPYAKRHWAVSHESSRYSLCHKVIAVLEYTPIIGGGVALIERISVFVSSFFSTPTSHTKGNATALEFIACINPTLFTKITPLTKKEVQDFLNRGGSLNTITEEKTQESRIIIHKEEQVITGCNSGINRSQVAAAVVIKMGISVKGVLAGGDSAMNPEADFPSFANPSEMGEELFGSATNFEKTFGIRKFDQVGIKELKSFIEDKREVTQAKKFYQDYIDQLSPTHFITFGPSGPSVLRRLLKRKGSLEGFTITHCPWGDEIAHPPESSGLNKYSTGSYNHFAKKLRYCFRTP